MIIGTGRGHSYLKRGGKYYILLHLVWLQWVGVHFQCSLVFSPGFLLRAEIVG